MTSPPLSFFDLKNFSTHSIASIWCAFESLVQAGLFINLHRPRGMSRKFSEAIWSWNHHLFLAWFSWFSWKYSGIWAIFFEKTQKSHVSGRIIRCSCSMNAVRTLFESHRLREHFTYLKRRLKVPRKDSATTWKSVDHFWKIQLFSAISWNRPIWAKKNVFSKSDRPTFKWPQNIF